jgi:histidinol dehydrogenase
MGSPLKRLDTRAPDFERSFERLERRRGHERAAIEERVQEIIEDVRRRGDDAVVEAVERYDGVRIGVDDLVWGPDQIEKGASGLDTETREAFTVAADRIRDFHSRRVPESWIERGDRQRLGQLVRPLASVAIYAPGAKAPLASTVLMLAMPAKVAGVPELTMATSGIETHPAMLEAARLSGVARLLRAGGAHAVAALAYGTERVPRVDKIVGPGSVWVQTAKRLVFGEVAIDSEAGPSEVLVIAEADANPVYVAADLLAQAEHEELASVVLISPSEALLAAVDAELELQIPEQPRAEIIRTSLADRSAAVRCRDLDEAFELGNRYAAEHLQLYVADADRWLERVENAGAVFIGPYSPVPLGDYVAGPSHVLPTGGTARFFSPVGVEDFVKRMSLVEFTAEGLRDVGPVAIRLAELEGLFAHAQAVRLRMEPGEVRRNHDTQRDEVPRSKDEDGE